MTASKIGYFVLLGIIVAYDMIFAFNPWRGDTISEKTIWAALRSFTVPAAWGDVTGHLFWPGTQRRPIWQVLIHWGVMASVTFTLDVLAWKGVFDPAWLGLIRAYPIITVLVCVPIGRVFWPQVRQ